MRASETVPADDKGSLPKLGRCRSGYLGVYQMGEV